MNVFSQSRLRFGSGQGRPRASRRLSALAAAMAVVHAAGAGEPMRAAVQAFPDATGAIATINVNGRFNERGAFFQALGSNGRSCATCHVPSQAMSFGVDEVKRRFRQSRGTDPLFAPIDGANCPTGRPGNAADHSLLLNHGLIRVFMPVPLNAQFSISVVHDPYGCAIAPSATGGQPVVSVYRRPLPSANLGFLSAVMFDGRETHMPLNDGSSFQANLRADLAQQAIDATTGHAQANQPPTPAQVSDIVGFELGVYTAQAYDYSAGILSVYGASGGPAYVADSAERYYPGINDSLGADPGGQAFSPFAMNLFAPWSNLHDRQGDYREQLRNDARRAIAAGEVIFNSAPLQISNVRGLNDNPTIGSPATFTGTCTSCHDTPGAGNHSLPLPLDIGTSHSLLPSLESDPEIIAGLGQLSLPDLPVYLVSGCPSPFSAGQPESFYTTDPGKALVSGQCSDFNRLKGPILRGLAARAPYFHNGAAASLRELVNFYNERFQMHLTAQQRQDLVAFLNSL